MRTVIGIDLGTTTSEIAYLKDGKSIIIPNDLGSKLTPSVVSLSENDEIIVGEFAKRQAALKPESTVLEVKRFMGTDKKISLGENIHTPQEISSMILKKLKKYAEIYIGNEIKEAVITVPANFNDLQRQATVMAGEMAGLKIERIINEPTAAALAYGLENMSAEENILVFDLGGGTFDVSVLEFFEGILDVKSSRGNNALGGKDFDKKLEDYVIEEFQKDKNIDLSDNLKATARIKEACERAKIELSSMEKANISLPFIAEDKFGNPLELNIEITREKFNELIDGLIQSTNIIIDEALRASGLKENDITLVLAVGGSSIVPRVKELLINRFDTRVKGDFNPQEAVALGAAVQAAIVSKQINADEGLIITDICSYSLGIKITKTLSTGRKVFGVFDPIITRDTKIPCSVKKTYYTSYDNQADVEIEIYEGEGKMVSENTNIGSFELKGIPPKPEGEESIEVTFTYNLNGMLEVKAKINSTSETVGKVINIINSSNVNMYLDSIIENLDNWEDYPLASRVKMIINIAEKKLDKIQNPQKQKIEFLLKTLKSAIINNNESLVQKYDDELTDILFEMQ
ncbi:Hsp70 family protein [Clostridium sp. 19966]|uniref:Hsp70 family protein n=1 Tax=Clostridium sp. 19966 TaxID=2768166 RepID=UPI0028E05D05|nr:Hsp70 family protein [Clostridium sp. 19966]MDT8716305.1 Hsp70 family protein [Clostridium sp. 19966]